MRSDDRTSITEGKSNNAYVMENIPPGILQQLEAGAFRSLVSHLQERSDQVQNIDLMTVSGFCRNCLAKVQYDKTKRKGCHVEISTDCSLLTQQTQFRTFSQ
jgi:hypothetical protein